ncbi:hypothetical protein ACWC4E_32715 [Streptomyces sp. NPDC001273]|uniref:hypothetical protein n=1 Tax=unclassified Streptomyces TaxID=2593676 RepID=UPI0033C27880
MQDLFAGLLSMQGAVPPLLLQGGSGWLAGRVPLGILCVEEPAYWLLGAELLGDRTQISGLGVQLDGLEAGLLGGFGACRVDLRGQQGQGGLHRGEPLPHGRRVAWRIAERAVGAEGLGVRGDAQRLPGLPAGSSDSTLGLLLFLVRLRRLSRVVGEQGLLFGSRGASQPQGDPTAAEGRLDPFFHALGLRGSGRWLCHFVGESFGGASGSHLAWLSKINISEF